MPSHVQQVSKVIPDTIVDRHANSFDLFRLMAATFVIFYHSYPLAGINHNGIYGLLGVSTFFAISGYFITQSWDRGRSAKKFVWNRFLRLIPALVLVVLFGIFIVGPLATALPLVNYATDYRTWLCFLNIPLATGAFNMPEIFLDNPVTRVWNGSLWTIHLEIRMYFVVMALGLLGLLRRKELVAGMTFAVAALYVIGFFLAPSVMIQDAFRMAILGMPRPNNLYPPLYGVVFLMGMIIYLYRDKLPFRLIPAACLGIVWMFSISTPYLLPATILCVPYLVLSVGSMKLPLVGQITKYGDFSYGLYIFAFPVQQTLVKFIPSIGPESLFAGSFMITLGLAILSWKLVESRALKLKRYDPWQLVKDLAVRRAINMKNRS